MIRTRKVPSFDDKKAAWYLVEKVNLETDEVEVIGMLEKWKNTRTDKHPWKALGRLTNPNEPRPFLGAFYSSAGRAHALAAVINADK